MSKHVNEKKVKKKPRWLQGPARRISPEPGMLLQFRVNPAHSLGPRGWVMDSGVPLWPGKFDNMTNSIFSSLSEFSEPQFSQDLYYKFALLVKIARLDRGIFYKVLTDKQCWWVHQNQFVKPLKGVQHK